jgi:polysaccharide export outer membrane protein
VNLQNLIGHRLTRNKTLSATCCIVALSGLLAIAPVQAITQEQMQMLQQMSPEQRAALIQQYGGGAQADSKPNPISTGPAAQPRQVGTGRLEADVKDNSADETITSGEVREAANVDVPLMEIQSQQGADKLEVRRSFEDFMREAKPLEVGTSGLQQFGYDLFASEPSTFAPVTDIPVPPEYVLGPGDEIKVQLYGGQNTQLALTVDREGAVSFPQIGPISVAGLSFAQAKALLAEQIKQKMIGVSASITMGQLRSIRIFALGDVYRPGSYTVSGLATLSSALFASGGVKKIGSLRNIELKRNGRKVTTIDLYDFLLRGDTSKDVRLLPGDVVFVPTIGKTVSIAGEVIRPAIYEVRNENTVADIIKLAGGLMPKAYLEKALIERLDAKGEQKVINLSLHDNGATTTIHNGDVIKIFAGTEFENNQIMLTGNLKRPGKYAWEPDMRVSSLITSMDDLLPETFMDYGVIEREARDTREPMLLRFKLGELLNPNAKGGELDIDLQARDRIYVFKRASFREQPKISVGGSVQNPGQYEHKRNMRLADLILAAGGLQRDTDYEFVEIYRTDPQTREVQLIKANLSKAMSGDAASDVALQDLDRVVVHSIYERKERAQVSVVGEVNNPGIMALGSGMRISDVIFASGNITEKAYLQNAEITRYEIENGIKRVSSHFAVNLEAALKGEQQADIMLQPYDVLNIRSISNWRTAEKVEVKGEVLHPGNYPVEEGETLSSLLQRVGGFTDKAYLRAAVFTRESIRAEQQREMDEMASRIEREIAIMDEASAQTRDDIIRNRQAAALDASRRLLGQLKSARATGRMVIELHDIEALKGTPYDVQLRDGDRLFVPKRPNEVLVVGDVYNRSALLHNPDYGFDDYIDEAGATRTADVDSAYIVRADGRVEMRGGWFNFASNNLQPGDTIVVPPDLERSQLLDSLLDWGRAMSQIAITLAAMKSIGAIQ